MRLLRDRAQVPRSSEGMQDVPKPWLWCSMEMGPAFVGGGGGLLFAMFGGSYSCGDSFFVFWWGCFFWEVSLFGVGILVVVLKGKAFF